MAGAPILPDAPAWFSRAVSVPHGDDTVDVDGCAIHYLSWGARGRGGLVFVHGGGAHAHWWTPLAATFAGQFRVAAIDLSGHGDSGHRERYTPEQWADEVMAVAADAGIDGLPVLIGHSMGGFVTMVTAARHSSALAGVIVCDSPVAEVDPEISAYHLREAFGRPRTYPSVEDAVDRFRTVPAQEHYLDYVMDFVARHSLKAVDGGWQWKFDRRIFEQFGGGVRSIALPYLERGRLPAGALAVRVRPGHARDRCLHVREARAGDAGHRDPRGRPPRHAGPALVVAHRPAHAAGRLGPLGAAPPLSRAARLRGP